MTDLAMAWRNGRRTTDWYSPSLSLIFGWSALPVPAARLAHEDLLPQVGHACPGWFGTTPPVYVKKDD